MFGVVAGIGAVFGGILYELICIYRIKYSQKIGILQSLIYCIEQDRKMWAIAYLKKNIKYAVAISMVFIGV